MCVFGGRGWEKMATHPSFTEIRKKWMFNVTFNFEIEMSMMMKIVTRVVKMMMMLLAMMVTISRVVTISSSWPTKG